jgi:hypothetical protein
MLFSTTARERLILAGLLLLALLGLVGQAVL